MAIDGVWYPEGWQRDEFQHDQASRAALASRYTARVRAGLPLTEARTFAPFVALVESTGYADVQVRPLHEIERLERGLAAQVGADIQPQYLISAASPPS